jgi:hypothetical protein
VAGLDCSTVDVAAAGASAVGVDVAGLDRSTVSVGTTGTSEVGVGWLELGWSRVGVSTTVALHDWMMRMTRRQ